MDGHLLVVIADTATHRGDALSLQARKEHLLTDTIGLQALTVDIKTDLLFLLSEEFHICYRGDTTQAVAQIITVLFQLAVAALVTLDGDEQCRGVAKVIVHHDGQHPTGQLRLEAIQTVFDLRPHLVLVVHVIVQFHHHDTHAVLRLRGRLLAIHLTKGKQIALQRTSHLLFHLFRCSARIDRHHYTLSDGGMWEFVLRHDIHTVDAHHKQDANDEQ